MDTRIFTGNAADGFSKIHSPQGFFQRYGIRAKGLKKGQPFSPSGSITVTKDRTIYTIYE